MYAYDTDKNMFARRQDLGCIWYPLQPPYVRLPPGPHALDGPSFFSVEERLIHGADADAEAPFLVDIGGSIGHDLAEFHSYYPSAPGKLILQDLPVVIGQIQELKPAITPMVHDFEHRRDRFR
ncbi:hypothetical protein CORC01_03516 [Colletotrichum orchidophilum]|uniref:O-methyltransferase n=1 Tax=Colletotrichum orchidophilum TaxID=1209926 RepID=A0A1G4BIF6_9PEZI|nr:uncharacterized protein CORC01_03516 [Colletotrichum orchidophilum]OHF01201.1 hypothetical protein CORC01_03516 [Colletotrichum orchidophilum]